MRVGDEAAAPPRPFARGRTGPVLRRVAWVATCLMGTLLAVELVARWLLPPLEPAYQRQFMVDTHRDRVPYAMFGKPPYNGPRPTAEKPPGEFRTVVLGGSTVEMGDPAFPALLEEELQAHGMAAARVYNYGVISSVTGQELARILFEVADIEPDLILMYDGANDIINPRLNDPRPGYPYDFVVWERNPLLSPDVASYPAGTLFLYGSYMMRYWFPRFFAERFVPLADVRRQVGYGTREWEEALVQSYLRNVVKANAVARAFGARFIAFFQPLVWYKEPKTEAESQMANAPEGPTVLYARERVRGEFARLKREGVLGERNAVDLTDTFDGIDEQVYWNGVHINQEFQIVVARRIRDAVLALLDRPPVTP